MREPTELERKVAKSIDDACRLGGLFVAKEANTLQNVGITPVVLLAMLLSSDKKISIIDAETYSLNLTIRNDHGV